MLNPDMSAFRRMLTTLGYPPSLTVRWEPGMYAGSFLSHETTGEAWRVSYIKLVDPDDWFSDERIAVCHHPWQERQKTQRIEWLDDVLVPRLPGDRPFLA